MERPPRKEPAVPPSTFVAPSREELMKDIRGVIVHAFEARTEYIHLEANIVTLASIRRILEKDLKVESGFLDAHKDFVAGLVKALLQGPETEKVIDELDKGKENVIEELARGKENVIEEPEAESEEMEENPKPKRKRLKRKADSEEVEDEVMMPVEFVKAEGEVELDIQVQIWEAAQKRASQFKAEAETLTVKKVRRLLEQDLEFENGALDAFKDRIRSILDEILNAENTESLENEESAHISYCEAPVTKTKKRKTAAPESTKKPSKKGKSASGEDLESNSMRKGKKSKKKVVQQEDEVSSGNGDDEEPSERGSSSVDEADTDMPERKKVAKAKPVESKPVYSRKVEHLKNIIKDCGITTPLTVDNKAKEAGVARRDAFVFLKVPPSVYKKAKQAGDSRREGVMIAELEAILAKEGLTASASRDEIKAVRKRKEKLKDLEGIDTSNIIEETRGRRSRTSANSFFAPRRNDPIDLGDEDEDEDEDEDGDDNSEGDPNVELQDDDDDED